MQTKHHITSGPQTELQPPAGLARLRRYGRVFGFSTALAALFVAALLIAPVSSATGGPTLATAPLVPFGVQQFGNTAPEPFNHDFWKLQLISGDQLTVNWQESPGSGVALDLWPPSISQDSVDDASKLASYQFMGSGGHDTFTYKVPSTGFWPLEFYSSELIGTPGPYQFTVTVKHELILSLGLRAQITVRGKLVALVHTPDGAPITDSNLDVYLYGSWDGLAHPLGEGHPRNGEVKFKLKLPQDVLNRRVRFVVHAGGLSYAPAQSSPLLLAIV